MLKNIIRIAIAVVSASVLHAELQQGVNYEWSGKGDGFLTVKTSCTLSDVLAIWEAKHPGAHDTDMKITFDNQGSTALDIVVDENCTLPTIGLVNLVGDWSLTYNNLYTVTGSAANLYVGAMLVGAEAKGRDSNLVIKFSKDAITSAMTGHNPDELVTYQLVTDSLFGVDQWYSNSSVSFEFGGAKKGEVYTYTDADGHEYKYTNVGIVPERQLVADTAAVFFSQTEYAVGSGFASGTFTVAFVGSNYVAPTPEPTTGTLSLLALAGLAARRRRK